MKKLSNKIETYQVTNSIYVDVVEEIDNNEDVVLFWLYHRNIGIKELMIGVKIEDIGFDKMWESIEDIIICEIENGVASYYANHIVHDDELQGYSIFNELSEEFSNKYSIDLRIEDFISL